MSEPLWLEWREATGRDRRKLQSFCCADPSGSSYDKLLKQVVHTEPWAREVEKALRNWSLRSANRHMWFGLAGDRIVGVGTYDAFPEEDLYSIDLVACAYDLRGRGIGEHIVRQLVAAIVVELPPDRGALVVALVDERNDAARAMFAGLGFAPTGTVGSEIREGSGKTRRGANYEQWAVEVE